MHIRLATPDDAAEVLRIYAPYCSTPISFELEPPSVSAMRRRISEVLEHYPWLLMVEGEQVLGYAYGHSFRDRPAYRWSTETSVYVDQTAHQRGVGSALYEKLLAMLKAQGFVSAMAGITLPNAASESLHRKFGFEFVGECKNIGYKLGAWHSVGFYELALNPAAATPTEALPLAAVVSMLNPANVS